MSMRIAGMMAMAVGFGAGLTGCVTSDIDIHRMPPETPAADNAAAIKKAEALATAGQHAVTSESHGGPDAPPKLVAADAPSVRTYDPWERLNRFSYRFNTRFDESVFLPLSNAYKWVPAPIRSGVHHIFGNLSEVDSVINYTLQGRLGFGMRSLGRFIINSTIGVAGVFDVATSLHLAFAPTGFGTTLAKWGMHPGPFLVIPFLGPSTVRGAVGWLGDYGTSYGINLADLYRGDQSWALGGVNAVDQRSNVSFRYYSTGSPFEYETIRFLYMRKQLLEDEGLHTRDKPAKRNPDVPAGR